MQMVNSMRKENIEVNKNYSVIGILAVLFYWILPVDLLPGLPIDDIIVTLAYIIINQHKSIDTKNSSTENF